MSYCELNFFFYKILILIGFRNRRCPRSSCMAIRWYDGYCFSACYDFNIENSIFWKYCSWCKENPSSSWNSFKHNTTWIHPQHSISMYFTSCLIIFHFICVFTNDYRLRSVNLIVLLIVRRIGVVKMKVLKKILLIILLKQAQQFKKEPAATVNQCNI